MDSPSWLCIWPLQLLRFCSSDLRLRSSPMNRRASHDKPGSPVQPLPFLLNIPSASCHPSSSVPLCFLILLIPSSLLATRPLNAEFILDPLTALCLSFGSNEQVQGLEVSPRHLQHSNSTSPPRPYTHPFSSALSEKKVSVTKEFRGRVSTVDLSNIENGGPCWEISIGLFPRPAFSLCPRGFLPNIYCDSGKDPPLFDPVRL